ncbi:hypothetical protein Pan258_21450 [Symmachiella dynata]|nr:hypothetical protein Pan258_21450 [Symmachiella dynata]
MILKLLYVVLGLFSKGAYDEWRNLRGNERKKLEDEKIQILSRKAEFLDPVEYGRRIQQGVIEGANREQAEKVDEKIRKFHVKWLVIYATAFVVVGIVVLILENYDSLTAK